MYRVLYDFNAEEDGEVSVITGEIVQQVGSEQQQQQPEGWTMVKKSNGLSGFVPTDYVKYEEPRSVPPTPPPLQKLNIVPAWKSDTVGLRSPANPGNSFATTPRNLGTSLGFSIKTDARKPGSMYSSTRLSSSISSIPTSKPSLLSAVDKEDFDDLLKRNEDYFNNIITNQAETFSSLLQMVDALSGKLSESAEASQDLVTNLTKLNELLDDERRKWKQQNEMEKQTERSAGTALSDKASSSSAGAFSPSNTSTAAAGYPYSSSPSSANRARNFSTA